MKFALACVVILALMASTLAFRARTKLQVQTSPRPANCFDDIFADPNDADAYWSTYYDLCNPGTPHMANGKFAAPSLGYCQEDCGFLYKAMIDNYLDYGACFDTSFGCYYL